MSSSSVLSAYMKDSLVVLSVVKSSAQSFGKGTSLLKSWVVNLVRRASFAWSEIFFGSLVSKIVKNYSKSTYPVYVVSHSLITTNYSFRLSPKFNDFSTLLNSFTPIIASSKMVS